MALIAALLIILFRGRTPSASQVANGLRQANDGARQAVSTAGRLTTAFSQIRTALGLRPQADGQEQQQPEQQPPREHGARRVGGIGAGIAIPLTVLASNLPTATACNPHTDPIGFDFGYDSCKFRHTHLHVLINI